VACSGGADSSALLLALAGVGHDAVVVAHVVHDLRPERDALGDRDAAARLAAGLGLPFRDARVRVRDRSGNEESVAREQRLGALGRIAGEVGASYIATGHQADDQLETVLMRLARGAGPAGLVGIRERRPIGGVVLVRPLLDQTRASCEDACRRAGWAWRTDATNADERRFRAAIRARVTPELRALAPGIERRIGRTCRLLGESASIVDGRARELACLAETIEGGLRWDRGRLAREPGVVIGALIRGTLVRRGVGADDVTGVRVEPVIDSIADPMDTEKSFVFDGQRVAVRGGTVEILDHAEERSDV